MTDSRRFRCSACIGCCVLIAASAFSETAAAQRRKAPQTTASGPADYRSPNFVLHTDMGPEKAQDLLTRLETMLTLISSYWGKPNRHTIEMFVVEELGDWPDGVLSPSGARMVGNGAGITESLRISRGNAFVAKAIVYACADRGTPQHEAVHAYCVQTFGETGPIWYAEGMAEMGQYWRKDDPSVNCHPAVVEYLRSSPPKNLVDIVSSNEFTGDSWQNYAWRWALCHLLANNPNYAPRFRPLGLGLLGGRDVSFQSFYGSVAREISFEYLFFLEHFDRGYRVDLCSWDWKARYAPARGRKRFQAKIAAAAGWQPSRLRVQSDKSYEFTAHGTWRLAADGPKLTADGDDAGHGRLMGVIFEDYELSEPIELGASGTFTAPQDGNLLLRCRDNWNELGDNSGEVAVRIRLQ